MKLNIWSDIRCPFCYIGKRKFEHALEKFDHRDKVEVVWRSFQLDPSLKTNPDMNAYDYLAKIKGMTREESVEMHAHVTQVAKDAGLSFHFDKTVVANSFNGHRLIQLAKRHGLGDAAEEELFKAHFTLGNNIDDIETLVEIGVRIGLEEDKVRTMLASSDCSEDVKRDETEARSIGIRGVPFFIFDDKFAVSGAQSSDTFLQTLEKAWEAYRVTQLD